MSANIIDSLLVRLGFEVDTEGLQKFKSEIAGITKTVGAISAGLTAAVGGVGLFVAHVADGVDELGDFAEREQVAADVVQSLGQAAVFAGSSFEAMQGSIAGLNQRMGEALTGVGRGAQVFQKLGLSAKNSQGEVKSLEEMLGDISDMMQGKSRQEQIAIATKLGIDRSLVPMLAKGRDYMAELVAEGRKWALSNDEVDKFSEFQDSMDRLKPSLKWVTEQIALKLLPSVQAIVKGLREWIDRSRDAISKNETIAATFKVLADVTIRMWDYIGRAVGALMKLVEWLTSSKVGMLALAAAASLLIKALVYDQVLRFINALRGLATMFTVANAAALGMSALIGALLIGIGLLIDDYLAWKDGQDSVIGDIVEKFPEVGKVIAAIEDVVRAIGAVFMQVFETIKEPVMNLMAALWNLTTTILSGLWPVIKMVFEGWGELLALVLPLFANVLAGVINGIATVIGGVVNGITGMVNFITGAVNKLFWLVDKLKGAAQWVGEKLGIVEADVAVQEAARQAPAMSGAPAPMSPVVAGAMPGAGWTPASAPASNNKSVSNTSSVQINAPITVNSPDPAKAGESVRQEIERMSKRATRNGQTAVAY